MTTTNLIELADAYAKAEQHDYLTGEGTAEVHRAELLAAIEAQAKQIEHWKTARESAMFAGEQMLDKLKEQAKQIFDLQKEQDENAQRYLEQIEALQADAKRYRWLRDVGDASFMALGKRPNVRFTHEIDAAIDLVRKGNV